MSRLEEVKNKKTITARETGLKEFLNTNDIRNLSEEESIQFRHIFQLFYTPNEGEDIFDNEEIQTVGITIDPVYRNKCFCIYLKSYPKTPVLCGKKYLAGAKRNPNTNIRQAARSAIFSQIEDFKNVNKLKVYDKCPGCSEKLGSEAQVDHEPTFQNLLNVFCLANSLNLSKIGNKYNQETFKREFEDSDISSKWSEYHKINAKLRWLCKECNQKIR